jgi:hypothetical protein
MFKNKVYVSESESEWKDVSILLGILYGASAIAMTHLFIKQEERTKDEVAAEMLIRRLTLNIYKTGVTI